ncbi:multidrug efflux RND transporter permease subunit [Veillonella magna]|uniref:Multidrug efflux RND transporter permease subunit n=1 Tax=Veillonella magna TaxID=464322 RepID=A0ABS2GG03_9FIRM|nr:multidrug efflux RND transporter permease subunit [Veillonella magna]MBM6912452.1 multidrug efflux RND transporter permease subunit [Veillonella magna]
MSKFFISRPIFAIVISLIITLVGLLAMFTLPVARYPQITPPQVRVSAAYTGASAQVVSDTVASVIESQIIGVQNMDYMVSTSTSNGTYSLTVQFDQGTDADMDTVNTQNRVQRALAQLPTEVQTLGVTTTKSTGDMALVFSLKSPNGTYDQTFLKNYASNYMMDEIKSVNGVGSVQEFGSDFAMRIWLDPAKMSQLGVTVTDVTSAIQAQNKQAAAGTIGANPTPIEQQRTMPITVQGRLISPTEFGNIIVKKDVNGNLLHLKDIAKINLGSKDYSITAKSDGKPVAVFAVSLTNDANAIKTIGAIKKILEEQAKSLPPDMEYSVIVDNTMFVSASIEEVIHTFIEALILVALIVYIFLQSWRSTIIPMIAVPVSLLGTFAAFEVLDFTINTLTLFAMVLAIGLVVDDAIVVIEAVEYEMKVNGLHPKEAALAAMKNVQGPVIGIAFVLVSVFVPVSFMGGMTGILYKQFALTIAVSVVISAFIALTLTPALCATMLKPHVPGSQSNWLSRSLDRFNELLERFSDWYGFQLAKLARKLWLTVVALIAFVAIAAGVFRVLPTSFVPAEDNGYFMMAINLPPGASSSRTMQVIQDVSNFLQNDSDITEVAGVSGFDILSNAQQSSSGVMFATLADWSQRKGPTQGVEAKIGKVFGFAAHEPQATILALNPPPIPGLGSSGGFTMYLVNKVGDSPAKMMTVANSFLAEARKSPVFASVYTTYNDSTPTYNFDVNRDKAARDGVSVADIYTALQGFYGGIQVNDFNEFGKNYKVMIQADEKYRVSPEMNHFIYVRNSAGNMVSVDTYIMPKPTTSAATITRFNNYPAVKIGGSQNQGYSSGDAINALKAAAAVTLPQGYTYDWADQSREEVKSGSQTILILGMGIIFVFLVLAALYESWKVPFAVLFSIPSGIMGAALIPYLLNFTGRYNLANDIYLQIGLLTLVGLAAKNAILIIEYAKIRVEERGMRIVDAAIEAAKIRLRPILMTSLAFILGCIPLAISSGAGAGARVSMGITVVAGMTAATAFGIFVIPMLFIMIEKLGFGKKK